MSNKLDQLRERIRACDHVLVAFSAGVDSTFVLAVAREQLGERALALTSCSESVPAAELEASRRLAAELGAQQIVVRTREIENPDYAANPTDRCFHCKSELYEHCRRVARERGIPVILNGVNADDLGDHRPGIDAASCYGVKSPLADLGWTKDEIRAASRELGLPTWDKPALACLASRLPYGLEVTVERLRQIESIEAWLKARGFCNLRVRHHDTIARIEIAAEEMGRIWTEPGLRDELVAHCKSTGFKYVTLDLQGYRSGSMNETLPAAQRVTALDS